LAVSMLCWSENVALCSDGPAELTLAQARKLKKLGVALFEDRISRLEGRGGRVKNVRFRGGKKLDCAALFFNTGSFQSSPLNRQIGCSFDSRGAIRARKYQVIGKPGIYAAGNILRDVQLSIVAAAEGAAAAFEINCALLKKESSAASPSPNAGGAPRP
jgi:thioredoxin reductase